MKATTKDHHDLEICVIDKTTSMLFVWNGGQTVHMFDANEYVRWMLTGKEPNTFGSFNMSTFGVPGAHDAEDFIASVHEHLMEGDDDEQEESTN